MPVTNEEVMIICANEYLEEIRTLKARVEFRKNEIEEMKSALDVGGISYESIAAGDVNRDALPEGVLKLVSYIDALDRELDEYQENVSVALKIIESLPPDLEGIARSYYIDGHTWRFIEDETHYSHTSIMRKRRRILVLAYKLMPEEERRKLPKAI